MEARALSSQDHPATVLLVEDNATLRDTMALHLTRSGYAVAVASDGLDGLEKLKLLLKMDRRPDLVVLDWVMPRMQGDEFCQRLKGDPATSRTPVIMLTGKSAQRDIEQGFNVGADEYITKPFEPEELIAAAQRLTGGA